MAFSQSKSQSLATTQSLPLIWPALVVLVSMFVGFGATPYKGVATFAYLMLMLGIFFRHRRAVHARLMAAGIAIDVLLVLVLEIERSAIAKTANGSLGVWQYCHVGASLAAVLLYFPVAYLGYQRLRNRLGARGQRGHLLLGILTFALRSIGFILMFSMANK